MHLSVPHLRCFSFNTFVVTVHTMLWIRNHYYICTDLGSDPTTPTLEIMKM
jgi:hypothetical protein